ncbi:Trafficking kinesin-binding 1 [Gossypium arboreum]|uniref:Trafficking kinesin-binding 1 n=1 Tax=Gossypium arboreum TaxID=29729 RepID=A0A0B0MYF7_GOSAR|nr:Trafficking kinesin-binding 1 [Gossypium arboreum]
MFRLHKTRQTPPPSNKSGEKIDFTFSNFKLVQVPKGWDRLIMSIISMENGKTMAKTSKAVVRNGSCQWTETLSESIWVSKTVMEDCFFKLVVAMGSARSSILGEATVNMTGYINSTITVPVSLPLKKCNHGTVLQTKEPFARFGSGWTRFKAVGAAHMKIQCLTPRRKPMDNESKQTNFHKEGNSTEHSPDLSLTSDSPESLIANSDGSSPSSAPRQEELVSREASFSASDSHCSYDSAASNLNGDTRSLMGIQDSPISQNGNSHIDDHLSHSNHSSFVSQSSFSDNKQEFCAASTLRSTDPSKNLLEAAEKTIEELHAEAKMQERNADKLMLDLDMLRKEYSDQSKNNAILAMELSAANVERNGLQKEVEQLKTLLEKSMAKQPTYEDSTFEDAGTTLLHKELENEIKFLKESNDSLALQLKRSQDANVELVSVLQELEQTIEKKKVEMGTITALQSQVSELENCMQLNSEENSNLMIQLQQSRESEKNLQAEVQYLEQMKNKESDALLDIEEEYKTKLAAKEREIIGLKVKLSESRKEGNFANPESRKGHEAPLIREIEALKVKLEELETDCNELTDENLELLVKIKETKNNVNGGVASNDFLSDEISAKLAMREQKSEMLFLEEKLRKKILREIQSDYNSYILELETQTIELEAKGTEVVKELTQKRTEMQTLEATLQSKKEENMELRMNQSKLQDMHHQLLAAEDKCEYLRRENTKLQATNETLIEECNSLNKSAEGLRKEKSELEEHCAQLEAKLKECSKKVEVLDENLTLVIEDFASKEKKLTLELNAIHDKSKKLEAKLKLEESSWNQMYLEKTNEVENLVLEVENLGKQLSAAHHEKEKTACEISGLQADKLRLDLALEEAQSNLKLTLSEFKKIESEAKTQVEDLLGELTAARENHEILMAEHEKALKLLESYKSSEGKLKTIVNELELKLTVSEYERQQVSEQSTNMKVQLLKIENLQDDISALTDERNAIKADKEKLEASLHLISRECDDLKAEKNYSMQQISTLQKVVSEIEDYKHDKIVLEEKLVRTEGDLVAKQALLMQDEEIKNELNEIKQTNRQFQQQIKQLQEEKDKLLIKAQTLEEKLKLKVEEKQKQRHSNSHRNKREARNLLPLRNHIVPLI